MSDNVKQKKRWFLKAEILILLCLVGFLVVKSKIVTVNSIKAAVLSQIVKINPNNIDAYDFLGDYYFDSGRYEKAIEVYKEAIRISPDSFEAHYNIGIVYDWLDNYEEQIPALKQLNIRFWLFSKNFYFTDT